MGALRGITSCAGRAALQEYTFTLMFPLTFQFQPLSSRPCTTTARGAAPSIGGRPRCGPGGGSGRPGGALRRPHRCCRSPSPWERRGGNGRARSPFAASGREGRVFACVCVRVPEVLRRYYRNRWGEAVGARPHPLPLPLPVPSMPARASHPVTGRRRSRAAMGRGAWSVERGAASPRPLRA